MSKLVKIASATLGIAMLAGNLAVTAGHAAPPPAAPKRAILGINNITGGCPAKVNLAAKILTKTEGVVQIRFQREDGSMSGPFWIVANKRPSGVIAASYRYSSGPIGVSVNAKYRVVASGAGSTKYSNWERFKVNC